jgi:hypothetical protein
MSYASFKEEWVRSVASRTEEGPILPAPWWFGARREYRLSEAQTNEVIARVGYAGAIALLICLFGAIALVIVLSTTQVLVGYVFLAVGVVLWLGPFMLLGGLIFGITNPVLAGISWTKAPPKPRKEVGDRRVRETAFIVALACSAFGMGAFVITGGGPGMIIVGACVLYCLYALIRNAWNPDGPLGL